MTLNERIEKEYIEAYKAKQQLKLDVLRLLKTAIKNLLVEYRRPGGSLDDAEIMDVLLRQAKQRQDSIEQYRAANRHDLADKEAAELVILQEYLPRPLSTEELAAAIDTAIHSTGASKPQDMGKVMAAMMELYKGRVDGKVLSSTVRQRLSN
ncbi:MAG: GatB/YqeY domain-containing protein [Desulfovibrionaceae bacterium]